MARPRDTYLREVRPGMGAFSSSEIRLEARWIEVRVGVHGAGK
jgi:hypothetical protein